MRHEEARACRGGFQTRPYQKTLAAQSGLSVENRNTLRMPSPAERKRATPRRRRKRAAGGLHLAIPDSRSPSVRKRIAAQVARLDRVQEDEALRWIEAVSEFDNSGQTEP